MDLKILITDDQKLMRQELRNLVEKMAHSIVIGEAENGEEAVQMAEELQPDVMIMDVVMPVLNGIEATRQIKLKHPNIHIVALSVYSEKQLIFEMFKAGASAYVPKDSAFEELDRAIQNVRVNRIFVSSGIVDKVIRELNAGHSPLTKNEHKVFYLLAEGKTIKEIVSLLKLSEKTVEKSCRSIMRGLNYSRSEFEQFCFFKDASKKKN